jgi:hypothetical protein
MGGGAAATAADMGISERSPFATFVPSTPHTGQFTTKGIRPLTGSTSNLYFWPQLQTTLSSIISHLWFEGAGMRERLCLLQGLEQLSNRPRKKDKPEISLLP